MKMGSSEFCLFFMGMMIMMIAATEGVSGFKEVLVGAHTGWHVPDSNQTDFYDHWAQSKRFHIGDSLRFQYENDSLLVVNKYGYYHCDTNNATSTFTDGNTVIKLENQGLIYFISGSPDHCRDGQRMVVDVMSPRSSPAPESKEGAEPPSTAAARKSGSHLAKASQLLGLVVVALHL